MTKQLKAHLMEGITLIQNASFDIIYHSNFGEYSHQKARYINSLCNQFLLVIDKYVDDKTIGEEVSE